MIRPALLVAVLAVPVQAQDLPRRIDSLVRWTLADERIPGLAVGVVRGRDTLLLRGYGQADLEHRVPATPQTVFRIGSITKQFTAAVILQLAAEGKLSLDDTLQRFVPNFPTPGRQITIRHLLTHTSGIPSYTSIGRAWADKMRLRLPHDSLMALVKDRPADFAPGERYRYNNTAYYLLGMIIENVTGRSYADALRERLFQPLGLTRTLYCDTRTVIPDRADGYGLDSARQPVNAGFLDMGQPFSAGSLCSTVPDLLAWRSGLAAGRVLPGAYEQMSAAARLNSGRELGYGFGLGLGELEGHRTIGHGGGINGFSANMTHYPADSLVVVVLSNSENANTDRLAMRIARIVLNSPEAPVRDLSIPAAERTRFAGTYRLSDAMDLRVFPQGDSLMVQATGQGADRILYQGGREFRASFDTDVRIVFEVDGSGRATTLVLYQGGERRAPRVN